MAFARTRQFVSEKSPDFSTRKEDKRCGFSWCMMIVLAFSEKIKDFQSIDITMRTNPSMAGRFCTMTLHQPSHDTDDMVDVYVKIISSNLGSDLGLLSCPSRSIPASASGGSLGFGSHSQLLHVERRGIEDYPASRSFLSRSRESRPRPSLQSHQALPRQAGESLGTSRTSC